MARRPAPAATAELTLPLLRIERVELTVIGDTSLICHAWSAKAREAMRVKQTREATAGREPKNPEQDYQDSLYRMPEGTYGFPVLAFKNAAVTACTSVGNITKVAARQAFHLAGELAEIIGEPVMREDMVRLGGTTADIRYRAEFLPWACILVVDYNTAILSAAMLRNLFATAGFAVGVGDWRPERDGNHGRFHIASEAELKTLRRTK